MRTPAETAAPRRRGLPTQLLHRPAQQARTSAITSSRRIYILPTGAGLAYACILFATLLGSLNYQNNLGLFLTFLMTSASLVSMHHCWFHLLGLRLTARDGTPVFCGQTAYFPVVIDAPAGRPRLGLCVRDAGCVDLPPAEPVQVMVARPTRRRGELALEQVVIETRYPLGLFRAWTTVRLRAAVLVYPTPAPRGPEPARVAAFEHRAQGNLGIGADDFVGPRSYRPGDSPRQLDWKALARERGLVVKQFGGDQAARIRIDWDQVRAGDDEARLSLLTRQVLDAHGQGLNYALRLPSVDIDYDRGDRHKHLCLAALARYPVGG